MKRRAMMAALLTLGACQGQDSLPDADSAAPHPDPVPAAGPPAPVKSSLPMGPAPGRWRFTASVQGAGTADVSREDCLRQRIDLGEAHMRQAPAGARCSDYAFRSEGASMIGTYACTLGDGSAITIETTTSGNMMSGYISTIVSTPREPGPGMPASITTVIVAERVGDCDAPPPPLFLDAAPVPASE